MHDIGEFVEIALPLRRECGSQQSNIDPSKIGPNNEAGVTAISGELGMSKERWNLRK